MTSVPGMPEREITISVSRRADGAIKAKSGRAEYLDESKKFAKEMQKALGEEVNDKITFAEAKKLIE